MPGRGSKNSVACLLIRVLQISDKAAYRKELGCINGVSAQEAQRISQRVDELLRPVGVLQAHSRNRPVDKKAPEDVPLETVAQTSHPYPESFATWSLKAPCIRTGLSSKGYWHLSRTLATQSGMTNEWFKELGLVSVRDIWIKVQGYDNTALAPS
jgi:hypothetical protein